MSEQTPEVDLAAIRALLGRLGRPLFAWLLIVIGVIALVVAWIGVSGQALVAKQLPYVVSGGIGGFAMIIVGSALIAGQDLRSVGDRLDRLERKVNDLHAVLLAGDAVPADASSNGSSASSNGDGEADGTSDEVVVVPEGARFHAPDCPIVADRDGVERIDEAEARARDLDACKVCQPSTASTSR